MKVLITGSSGRIGQAIYAEVARQHTAVGFDRLPAETTDVIGDIGDLDLHSTALDGVDVVIHTAALHAPHVGQESEAEFDRVNVQATQALALSAVECGVKHFVFTSTTALYGQASRLNDKTAWITENTQPKPVTVYHRSKIQAEEILNTVSMSSGLPITVLRMSRCFPEPADLMALYRLARGIDKRDVATAHLAAINQRPAGFTRFIVSAAPTFTPDHCDELFVNAAAVIKQTSPELANEFQARGWRLPGSIDRVYDSRYAQQQLGWQPKHGFASVIQQLDAQSPEVLKVTRSGD